MAAGSTDLLVATAGGYNAEEGALLSVKILDLRLNEWVQLPHMTLE